MAGCGDVLSLEDLQTAKKHQIFEAEVITGKTGGVAGGAYLPVATNPVTGQAQETLPQILSDLGMQVQPWSSSIGGTLTTAAQIFLNDTPGSLGIGDYYAWGGPFPKTVPAGTDPALPGSGYILRSNRFIKSMALESLRRSYAEAGYIVVGTFQAGFTYANANDVGVDEATGKGYTGPVGAVAPGTIPVPPTYIDRSGALLRSYVDILSDEIDSLKNLATTHVSRGTVVCAMGHTVNYHRYIISPNHKAFRIKFSDDAAIVGSEFRNSKLKFSDFRKESKYRVMTNALAWTGVETGDPILDPTARPLGLVIADGVAYQDFEPTSVVNRGNIAFVINRDNTYRIARLTDGKTAQQYVDEGAWISLGWSIPQLVSAGVAQPNADVTISARSAICSLKNGSYAIFQMAGKSGEYGMTYQEFGAFLAAHDVFDAIGLDGGGSTQGVVDDFFVHASTDGKSRDLGGGILCIDGPCNTFSSDWIDWPLGVNAVAGGLLKARQVGSDIEMHLNLGITPTQVVGTYYDVGESPTQYRPVTSYYSGVPLPPLDSRSKKVCPAGGGHMQNVLVISNIVRVNTVAGALSLTKDGGGFVKDAVILPAGNVIGSISYPCPYLVSEYV